MAPLPLVLDVDTGIDDALALLYAVASPDVEMVAATAVSGNVGADRAARNTLAVLELAGVTDVEVAEGAVVAGRGAAGRHGPEGLGHATLPPPSRRVSSRTAPRLIVDEARARPGELVVVATGPLTNVAAALALEPGLPRLLRGVTIGGGAYGRAVAETNMLTDPAAARAVFAAWTGADVLPACVGLDVTEQVRITHAELAWLRTMRGSDRIARFLDAAVSFAIERSALERGLDGAPLHDPLALAVALDEELAEFARVRVWVDDDGIVTTDPPSDTVDADARVVRRVDTHAFMARFVDRLGTVATTPGRPR